MLRFVLKYSSKKKKKRGGGDSSQYLERPKRNHTCLPKGCIGRLNTKCLYFRQERCHQSSYANDYVDVSSNKMKIK